MSRRKTRDWSILVIGAVLFAAWRFFFPELSLRVVLVVLGGVVVTLVVSAVWPEEKPDALRDQLRELRRQILEQRLRRLAGRKPLRLEQNGMSPSDRESIEQFLASIDKYTPDKQEEWRQWIGRLLDDMAENGDNIASVWSSRFAKLTLPALLGIIPLENYRIAYFNHSDIPNDMYAYTHSGFVYTVEQFEAYRLTIEEIWRGKVIIEPMGSRLPGCVRIRPLPRLPVKIPLTQPAPGEVTFGTDLMTGKVVSLKAASIPHLLIMGTSGFGKSVFLHQLVAQLLYAPAEEVERITLVDLKGGVEFVKYASGDGRVCTVWKFDEVVEVVDELVAVMEARQLEMLEKRWRTYKGRRIFFVVDEFAQIQLYPVEGKDGKAAHAKLLGNLNRLSMLGRSAGIVIVAAIQKATTDVMDSSFRTNLQGQVCFRVPNRLAAASMFGTVDDLRFDPVALPRGQYIFYDPTVGETRYLQAHVTPDEMSENDAAEPEQGNT